MSIISLTDITASYGSKGVLKHFSLDIGQGEFVMLIGTSGCGKNHGSEAYERAAEA